MRRRRISTKVRIQRQLSRILSLILLAGLLYSAKFCIPIFQDSPTSIEGHAPLKTTRKFDPVTGEPSNIQGFSYVDGAILKVSDGDTVDFQASGKGTFRLRLLGIDAPDLRMGDSGAVSKGYLQKLLGRCSYDVKVLFRTDENRDSYGRFLGIVFCDGKNVNLEMVKGGQAWVFPGNQDQLPPEDRAKFREAQSTAKQNKLGLWKESNPIEPWEWRDTNKKKKESEYFSKFIDWLKKFTHLSS